MVHVVDSVVSCLCIFRSFVKIFLYVVALCRMMTSANASGKVVLDSCGWYIFVSLCNLAFRMGEMSRQSWAWSSTESRVGGWDVISNAPVGMAYRSGLIEWVV